MTLKDIRPAEDLTRFYQNLAESPEPGIEASGNWKHIKKDGSVIDVEITLHALEFDGRKAKRVLAHDITERKKANEALRLSEERFKSIIATSNTGAWEYHSNIDYLWCSPEYFTMLGHDPEAYMKNRKWNISDTGLP